ncbi:MAG: hypothetical protein II401_04505 [Bacteroidales bacterium]|nr:hypothetical protein [Bacteroidales bacterium]
MANKIHVYIRQIWYAFDNLPETGKTTINIKGCIKITEITAFYNTLNNNRL